MTLRLASTRILTMSWNKYRNHYKLLIAATAGSLVTFLSTKLINDLYSETEKDAYCVHSIPNATVGSWNSNWDCREPKTLLQPMRLTPPNEQLDQPQPKALRHIILVRHGEYIDYKDGSHHLTERGRKQAKLTGQRLLAMGIQWDHIVASTMTRALETANIIVKELNFDPLKVKRCKLLPEGMPIPPVPPTRIMRCEEAYHRDGPRIEAAFRRYFFRASPEQQHDSYLLIVGHSNVIRYFVCRALQFPPEAWTRMVLSHGSITWLTIAPTGHVSVKYIGDSGFIPANQLTTRRPQRNSENVS